MPLFHHFSRKMSCRGGMHWIQLDCLLAPAKKYNYIYLSEHKTKTWFKIIIEKCFVQVFCFHVCTIFSQLNQSSLDNTGVSNLHYVQHH